MSQTVPATVIGKLRESVVLMKKKSAYTQIIEAQEAVLARFQPVFAAGHIPDLTEEEFRTFLLTENNQHWSGLHRQGPRICANMGKLRKALLTLVDDSQPVVNRVDTMDVPGMGKNIITAILMISQPGRYGVWNNRSEGNMKRLGLWPTFDRGESFGKRYDKVNTILLQLREALQVDLWTLDALWWFLDSEADASEDNPVDDDHPGSSEDATEEGQCFGLERHLHEFLRDNWGRLELGYEWSLYQEPGDEEAGYEYPCDVGRIDLLAKHKTERRWLVIELKRNQSSDQTIGQLLRYMGWVKQHLAERDEAVCGMVICRGSDEAMKYAIAAVQNVELRLYEVNFKLLKSG